MAEHASVADSDIDIGSHAGTLDLTGNHAVNYPADRDGRRSSLNGPMIHQNKSSIAAWCAVGVLFAIALGLSGSSWMKSNTALQLAEDNAKAIETSNEQLTAIEGNVRDAAAGGAQPQPVQPLVPATPVVIPTSPPTTIPTPLPTTPKPTDPHPLDPQWFQTTHKDYQEMVDSYEEAGSNIHSYRIAQQVCSRNGRKLCDYGVYCPNGQGSPPYAGGPPLVANSGELEETQWAPYQHSYDDPLESDPATTSWVQIGKMDESNGGKEGNQFVECWKFDDWNAGSGEDVEEGWGEEHRMWMLCCKEEAVESAPTPAEPSPSQPPPFIEAPTEPHPLNPRWIQTVHDDYQMFDEMDQQAHSYRVAENTCQKQKLMLCAYDTYCPNGQGNGVFGGGPQSFNSDELEETQWAPVLRGDGGYTNDPAWSEWVQIGTVPAAKGGKVENDFGKCYKFDDFYEDTKENIEDEWGEEHMAWILCCETEPAPTPAQPTVADAPAEDPLNPKWFQTTHEDYQEMEDLNEQNNITQHSYRLAQTTCFRQGLVLCDYGSYCPNGLGNEPFGGGPQAANSAELEVTQWAPYEHGENNWSNDPAWSEWVQIGKMSAANGGDEDNDYVKCYKFDDWYQGTIDNIEDEWGEEHTMWMLCCEKEPPAPTPAQPVVETPAESDEHPLKPRWFQTTHEDYVQTLEQQPENCHSYRIAQTTCGKQGLKLCAYDTYCPNGQGNDPFGGGPQASNSDELEETQWAPYHQGSGDYTNDPAWSEWVQIGKMSTANGGNEDNDFVKCYKFDDWYQDSEQNIEDVWEEEHTMWILCCENEPVGSSEPAPTPPAPEPTEIALNPKWYQTTHQDYQDQAALDASLNNTYHSYSSAWFLCNKQDGKHLCPLETYCPNGQGGAPFDGGPPEMQNSADLDATQWAPFWVEDFSPELQSTSWVQVGEMSTENGGNDDNDFLKCWSYDDWYAGDGVDIEEKWGEEHTMWILCCDHPDTLPATPTSTPPAPEPTGRNPKWYQTTHQAYQKLASLDSGFHSYGNAWAFCTLQDDKVLCPYEEYCPNGEGKDPFDGGPPQLHNHASLEENQWAPFWVENSNVENEKTSWVQVGIMPAIEGGNDDNGFFQCHKSDDYSGGDVDDIEDEWEDKHRVWILCCDKIV